MVIQWTLNGKWRNVCFSKWKLSFLKFIKVYETQIASMYSIVLPYLRISYSFGDDMEIGVLLLIEEADE